VNPAFAVRNAKLLFIDVSVLELLSGADRAQHGAAPQRLSVSAAESRGASGVFHVHAQLLALAPTLALDASGAQDRTRDEWPWSRVRDDAWLLLRIVYKSSNQHRSAPFMDKLQRAARLLRQLWRPLHVDCALRDVFALLPARPKVRTDNPALVTVLVRGAPAALCLALCKLLLLRDEVSELLSALRAARPSLQTQLAQGFFAALALAGISCCARVHVEMCSFRALLDTLAEHVCRVGIAAFGSKAVVALADSQYTLASESASVRRASLVHRALKPRLVALVTRLTSPVKAPADASASGAGAENHALPSEDLGSVVDDVPAAAAAAVAVVAQGPTLKPQAKKKKKKRKVDELDDIFALLD